MGYLGIIMSPEMDDPRFLPPMHTPRLRCDRCGDVFWVLKTTDPRGSLCFVCGTAGTAVPDTS